MKSQLFLLLFSFVTFTPCFSQIQKIEQTKVFVNWDKTTHLIFPTNIKYFNTVNDFIVADKPTKAENLLSVKANTKDFNMSSNLSVATSDGKFYSFIVSYTDSLRMSNLFVKDLSSVKPDVINVNTFNNTHFVFPSEIIYIDYGNNDFLEVDPAESLRNVLRIKAISNFAEETNVSVYTADNTFYTFNIVYNEEERNYSYQLGEPKESIAMLNDEELTDAKKKDILNKIEKKGRKIFTLGANKNKIGFAVQNIFTETNKMIFRLGIQNKSNIKYDIDYIKFFIQDKKTMKESASQEIELEPLFIDAFSYIIEGKDEKTLSVCFEKFTIPDQKRLVIEINEKNGGRHILFKLNNSDIINAETL